MRHLQHPALKRKRRTAEQIDHAAAVLRINVFQIQQNAFAAKQIFDDFAAFLNLANVDNALAVGVLRLLRGAGSSMYSTSRKESIAASRITSINTEYKAAPVFCQAPRRLGKNCLRIARMKVSSTFSKVAGCRGGALARAPQSAELPCAY